MGRIVGDGVWLGTAAVCSGFAWQPIVNLWQGLEVPFNAVFAGTWVGCGLAFLGGLRLGRLVYPFVGAGDAANFTTVRQTIRFFSFSPLFFILFLRLLLL